MKYIEPLFRPPAEANSLIFQVAYGCPHNTCRFCGMYKTVTYRRRDLLEVLQEIRSVSRAYSKTRRIFLADGDVMMLPFEDLHAILTCLNDSFPRLSRVGVYANGSSIILKSEKELCELKKLKLGIIYLGLESGSNDLLKLVAKNENTTDMIDAVQLAQSCGIKSSVMVLLGLGGQSFSAEHASKSAEAINAMQPRLLSALRFIEVPGASMFKDYEALSEYETVYELRQMIDSFELSSNVFRANHTSNPVPLAGRFPHDKDRLLAELDLILAELTLDREGPGRLPSFM